MHRPQSTSNAAVSPRRERMNSPDMPNDASSPLALPNVERARRDIPLARVNGGFTARLIRRALRETLALRLGLRLRFCATLHALWPRVNTAPRAPLTFR